MVQECGKTIAVLFTDLADCDSEIPFPNKMANKSNSIFSKKADEAGLKILFARYVEYQNGKLKRAWIKQKNKWHIINDQKIDLVYSRFARAMFLNNKENQEVISFKFDMVKELNAINHPIIDKFCWDKRIVSEIFPEYTPRTFVINTFKGLMAVLPEIKTERIVFKPQFGTLGEKVIITDRNSLPKLIEKNTIVQEFIDTSKGIDGIIKGYHDLRLIMINGKIDHAHVRIPKKGTLTANVALGGKKIFIKNEKIPKKAIQIAKKVDKLFKSYKPRIYSIDFLIDENQRPYIVECNSQPVIDRYAYGKYADLSFYDRILKIMKAGIKIKVVETI